MNKETSAILLPDPETMARTRAERMRIFIIILSLLTLPLLVLGVIDQVAPPSSLLTLIAPLAAYGYYGIYYLLVRAGYGVPATYACVVVLALLIAVGSHTAGGYLTSSAAVFLLLLIGVGLVLDDPRGLDVTLVVCLLGYAGLGLYEEYISGPEVLGALYRATNPLVVATLVVMAVGALIGAWLVMRINLVSLRRSTRALEHARARSEEHARENAGLLVQVQQSNHSLLEAQARLRATIDALALPLIPLHDGVALLPLIGYVDQTRAEQLVAGLLHGVESLRANTIILDITGLRAIDAELARTLIDAAQAARLLGVDVILSGISADAARALAGLGTNLGMLRTAGRLSEALRLAQGAAGHRDGEAGGPGKLIDRSGTAHVLRR